MPFFREDQALIHVQVAGVFLDTVSWDTFEGGDIEAQNVNYRPGGMQPSIDLGGPATRTDVTVARLYSDFLHAHYVELDAVCGKASMQASYTPLDADGNPNGKTIVYTGVLKQVMRPNADSTANAASKLSLVMGCNQPISEASN